MWLPGLTVAAEMGPQGQRSSGLAGDRRVDPAQTMACALHRIGASALPSLRTERTLRSLRGRAGGRSSCRVNPRTRPLLNPLFISRGAPTLPLTPGPARGFLSALGGQFPRPRAILVVSAHYQAPAPTLTADANPETVHDFSGFPRPLYALRYPASGDPGLARTPADGLQAQGWHARVADGRGLDHGAWVPLMLMYPAADIPVVQLSLVRGQGPKYHWGLGQALRPLVGEGVLILGSGSLTHNLGELDWSGGAGAPWVTAFTDWFAAGIETGESRLLDYRTQAPNAVCNHPTEEHLLPLFVALGAGATGRGRRLHSSIQLGVLAMDAYAFN